MSDTGNQELPLVRRRLIMATAMAATMMQAIDTTIANVALPNIQGAMSASQEQIAWVVTSYIVASAIATPVTGWLVGRFGMRTVFGVSVAGFTFASALCGLATSLEQIVFFRLLQGVFGAALVPLSQAVLFDITPVAQYGRAMAIWGMGVIVGPIIGPALGGWLTQSLNWRWVFFINVPIGIFSCAGLLLFVPPARNLKKTSFDFFGFGTLSVAVAALQLVLDRGSTLGWFGSTEIQIEAVISGLAFYLFVVHTATTSGPSFFSPGLLKDRNFVAGNLLMFLLGMVLLATLTLLPALLQQELGYPVITTGYALAPRGFGSLLGMLAMGRLIEKIDIRIILCFGIAVSELALWQMSHFSLEVGTSTIIISGMLQGLGSGCVWVPLSTVGFATLDKSLRNEGTAVFSLIRNLGSSLGISVWEALLTDNTQRVHARLAEAVTPDNPLAQAPWLPAPLLQMTPEQLAALGARIGHQAQMVAYMDDFWGMMLTSALMFPLMLLLNKPKKSPTGEHGLAAAAD